MPETESTRICKFLLIYFSRRVESSRMKIEIRNITLNSTVTRSERKRWNALAEKRRQRPSTMVREAVLEFLERHEKEGAKK